jgi:hypothetical protein
LDSTESQPSQKDQLSPIQHEFFFKYLLTKKFNYYSDNLYDWLKSNPVF